MIQVQIKGLNKVQRFIGNLPKKMDKEINNESGNWMKLVKKSAKLRAPRHTGELAKSIFLVKKGNQWILEVRSPYGRYQEEGFAPHWIHAWMPTKNSLGTVGDALNIAGLIKVKKNTPFIAPAIEHNLSKLANKMFNASSMAIRKS